MLKLGRPVRLNISGLGDAHVYRQNLRYKLFDCWQGKGKACAGDMSLMFALENCRPFGTRNRRLFSTLLNFSILSVSRTIQNRYGVI